MEEVTPENNLVSAAREEGEPAARPGGHTEIPCLGACPLPDVPFLGLSRLSPLLPSHQPVTSPRKPSPSSLLGQRTSTLSIALATIATK